MPSPGKVLTMDEGFDMPRLQGNSLAQSSALMMRPVLMSLVTLLTLSSPSLAAPQAVEDFCFDQIEKVRPPLVRAAATGKPSWLTA
jgi:hypothetical protein